MKRTKLQSNQNPSILDVAGVLDSPLKLVSFEVPLSFTLGFTHDQPQYQS